MTLARLIEAVEAGTAHSDFLWSDVKGPVRAILPNDWFAALEAYNGSLDAAKRLHDALLPGWRVVDISELNSHGLKGKWVVELASWTEEKYVRVMADDEARARLLAILRAMEGRE